MRDEKETRKLDFFGKHMQELEDNLPLDKQYRNPKVGALAPMVVVNQVYGAGDGNMGVQTAAYNLPNDERIISQITHGLGPAFATANMLTAKAAK